ncbi:MAG: hypothetical protein ACTHOH_17495, partial [Lysobacteraceae bacterium]
MSDIWMLRIGIVVAGLLLMGAIYMFGRPRKPGQGRKVREERGGRSEPRLDPGAPPQSIDLGGPVLRD